MNSEVQAVSYWSKNSLGNSVFIAVLIWFFLPNFIGIYFYPSILDYYLIGFPVAQIIYLVLFALTIFTCNSILKVPGDTSRQEGVSFAEKTILGVTGIFALFLIGLWSFELVVSVDYIILPTLLWFWAVLTRQWSLGIKLIWVVFFTVLVVFFTSLR